VKGKHKTQICSVTELFELNSEWCYKMTHITWQGGKPSVIWFADAYMLQYMCLTVLELIAHLL